MPISREMNSTVLSEMEARIQIGWGMTSLPKPKSINAKGRLTKFGLSNPK
jgi:hypothetical protein